MITSPSPFVTKVYITYVYIKSYIENIYICVHKKYCFYAHVEIDCINIILRKLNERNNKKSTLRKKYKYINIENLLVKYTVYSQK